VSGTENLVLVAAVEAGGTTFRVAIGNRPGALRAQATIPTGRPGDTLAAVIDFLRGRGAEAVGIAAFGPIDLDPVSPGYGHLLATPKEGWEGTDVLGSLRDALGVPAAIDTDVGAAALAERRWGAARGLDDVVYLTVGTGIGGGVLIGGEIHHGCGHPEVGHIPVARRSDDRFAGCCPFHGACLEGMASGTALEARWGRPADELDDREDVWDLEAHYLAQAVEAVTYVVAPRRVVFGGEVLRRTGLIERIRARFRELLGGYAASAGVLGDPSDYVVGAGLGQDAGLLGAVALGLRAAGEG